MLHVCVLSLETCGKCVSVFGANGNLRTEAGDVFRNGELTEDRQAPAAGLAGLGAGERAGRAAPILVLVRQRGVGQGAGPQRP